MGSPGVSKFVSPVVLPGGVKMGRLRITRDDHRNDSTHLSTVCCALPMRPADSSKNAVSPLEDSLYGALFSLCVRHLQSLPHTQDRGSLCNPSTLLPDHIAAGDSVRSGVKIYGDDAFFGAKTFATRFSKCGLSRSGSRKGSTLIETMS